MALKKGKINSSRVPLGRRAKSLLKKGFHRKLRRLNKAFCRNWDKDIPIPFEKPTGFCG